MGWGWGGSVLETVLLHNPFSGRGVNSRYELQEEILEFFGGKDDINK